MNAVLTYWQRKSAQEQTILLVAALAAVVMLGWLLVASPLLSWRDDARSAYRQSAASHDEIMAGIARYQAVQGEGAASRTEEESVRSVVAGAASRSGLVLSRVLPDEAGRLNVWIDSADAPVLIGWLETLSRDHGVIVVRASMERADGSQVRAQILLARGGE